MWFGTPGGLNRYDGVNWTIYKHRSEDSTSINHNHVRQVIEDKAGNLIIELLDENQIGKLDFFDKKTATFSRARFQNIDQGQHFSVFDFYKSLSGNIIALLILEERQYPGDLQTIQAYQYSGDGQFKFRRILSPPSKTLPSERVQPSAERKWLITQRSSYRLIDVATNDTRHFYFKDFGGYLLPFDANGKFWYPALNPENGRLFDPFDLPTAVPLKEWRHFSFDNYDNIWLTTNGGRVYKYDVKQKYIDESGEFDLDTYFSSKRLLQDKEGTLWIPHTFGLAKIRKRQHYFEHYFHNPDRGWDKEFGTGTEVYSMVQDSKDTIFAIFGRNGLLMLDPKSKKGAKRPDYLTSTTEKPHLSAISVMMVATEDGYLWLGEYLNQIVRFHPESRTLKVFHIPDRDYLWMGTQYGLCRFNTKTGEVKNYYEEDGLTHNEFNREAALKTRDGKLYFGGINGINAFDPEALDSLARLEASPLIWTQFSKLDVKRDSLKVYPSHQLDPLSKSTNLLPGNTAEPAWA